MPAIYSCEGKNINPPLEIKGVPAECLSLALIVEDPDAPGRVWQHWLIWNIAPNTTKIDEGSAPPGAVQGLNDFGRTCYGGPCPPSGIHHYYFRLYALDTKILVDPKANRAELDQAMDGHIIAQAELMGSFGHQS